MSYSVTERRSALSRLVSLLLLLVPTGQPLLGQAADETAPAPDPYADEPYWYQPGHPVDPADATAITTLPGFVAERVFTVPRELGSWTALGIDARGRLLAAAQHQPGIFRITPAPTDQPNAETKVEKLGQAAAQIGWAHSLLVAFDSLFVTVSEENPAGIRSGVYRLMDTDGDDQYDASSLLFALNATGEHGPHGIIVAPDGRSLLMMVGNATPIPEPFRVRRPVPTTGHDHMMPPGFDSSEHSTQGWVLRFAPDGTNPEVILTGLRNAFHLAANAAGDLFTFDSDAEWDLGTPWYRPTRINHLVSGGEYGWRSDAAVWPEHFEDAVPPVLNIGPGSPTGVVFGYGTRFPARYQQALFALDWTFATVHAVFLTPAGGSYRAESEVFLGGVGLPLTHALVGVDGALYLNVGGRRLGSAIYRVRYIGEEPTAPVRLSDELTELHRLRRTMEAYHGRHDERAVEEAWPLLGHADRAIRFAGRVAIESQPVEQWRDRVFRETQRPVWLTAALALARQGNAADLGKLAAACGQLPWADLGAQEQLSALRIVELVLARAPQAVHASSLTDPLRPLLDSVDTRVVREASRLLCLQRDRAAIPRLLQLMAEDAGERRALGTEYFSRNPKYGQAVRDMLEAAPLQERMHHAQMLLWLLDEATTEQRRDYFTLIADALAHSKGGHSYGDFWQRIIDSALSRAPEAERETLAAITAAAPAGGADANVPQPVGPGREWTTQELVNLASTGLKGRDRAKGEAMFTAAACATCHRLGATGGNMGPDLSALGQRFTLRDIVEAIVEPSRAISDQYQMVVFELNDGTTVSGRIVSRDARSTAVATNLMRPSQTTTVRNDVVVKEESLPLSTMPSGLLNRLNEDEALDLLAYLISGGDPAHAVHQP